MVTLLALCLGLTAVRQGLEGRFELAVMCIVIAGFLDAFDGAAGAALESGKPARRAARLADRFRQFRNCAGLAGVSVGLAINRPPRLGNYSGLFRVLRAAFGALLMSIWKGPTRSAWKTRYFIGVPSPSAGGLVMLPIYLQVAGLY